MKTLTLIVLAAAAIAASSCSKPVSEPGKTLSKAATQAIKTTITADPKMAGADVEVVGDRENIILMGSVVDEDQKKLAEKLAEEYDEKLTVENDLIVSGVAGGKSGGNDYGR